MNADVSKIAKTVTAKAPSALSGVDATRVLEDIIQRAQEYMTVREQEMTKRANIETARQVALEELHNKREIILTYLHESFREREANFASLFGALDKAMTEGGDVASILGAITTLAASGPFKDIQDFAMVKTHLADKSTEWEV